ncbi:MAG: hydroxymethylbilane synthase [Betaproteobacteria bacterium]|nr:hydroxymethylbilane synthase [Betaproteobacteria bacterium]
MSSAPKITIATRESRLALWQAEHIRDRLLGLYPHAEVHLLGMTTTGDQILDRTLAAVGGKGLFVKELELAMLERRAEMAVHSMKDVPMELPPEFALCVAGEREDPRDAFVSVRYAHLEELPAGAVVGTSSLRRECQLRARYPHLSIQPLRGNLDTRLRKLDAGEYQAIILAAAGLKRLGLSARIRSLLPIEASLPAVGQGALGIEFRTDHPRLAEWLAPLRNAANESCVWAERTVSRRLAGSCDVPLGAHATIEDGVLSLQAFVGSPDGSRIVRAAGRGDATAPVELGETVAEQLLEQGAADILNSCRSAG